MSKPDAARGRLAGIRNFGAGWLLRQKFYFIAGLAFFILTVGYIIWQVLSINKTPSLKIITDKQQCHFGFFFGCFGTNRPGNFGDGQRRKIFLWIHKGEFDTWSALTPGPKNITVSGDKPFWESREPEFKCDRARQRRRPPRHPCS